MRYRAEIDGLRAISILSVILFHAGFPAVPGGYVGVDVFFVISGYLITSILRAELAAGRFSLSAFYERRARRILPALFLVMLCSLPMAGLLLGSEAVRSFFRSLIAVPLLVSNIEFWRESGYFNPASETKPLLHTWSLAVEEQYYLLFPMVFAALWRWGKPKLQIVLGLLALGSLGLAGWLIQREPDAAFFLLPSRAWEILAGAILALQAAPKEAGGLASSGLSALGLGLVLAAVLCLGAQSGVPAWPALLPVAGAVLLLRHASEANAVGRLLGHRWLVHFGLLSYSAYLWHQPLFTLVRALSLSPPGMALMMGLSLALWPLAWLSWRYVEQPFRRAERVSRRQLAIFGCSAAALFVALGLVGEALLAQRPGPDDALLAPNHGLSAACDERFTLAPACQFGSDPHAVLWGDSYAMHLAPALIASATPMSFRQHTRSSCPPLLGASLVSPLHSRHRAEQCIAHNGQVLDWLMSHPEIDLVILASSFYQADAQLLRDGAEQPANLAPMRQALLATAAKLREAHKKVLIIAPPPGNGNDLGACWLKARHLGRDPALCGFSPADFSQATRQAQALLRGVEPEIPVLWLDRYLCASGPCQVSAEAGSIYRDVGHLSIAGSQWLGRRYDLAGEVLRQVEMRQHAELFGSSVKGVD